MSLPKRSLRELRSLCLSLLDEREVAVDETQLRRLGAQLDACLKPKRAVVEARGRRVVKKRARREVANFLRALVVKRAEGTCEACGSGQMGLEVDHFFGGNGRRKALEAKETCWALCHSCHLNKTNNRPSPAYWLRAFASHAEKHGFGEAWQQTVKRLSSLDAQGRAS
jgi:5-methylcytosine-specific restriction endonuclease McrA